jgi:hypothetical protein
MDACPIHHERSVGWAIRRYAVGVLVAAMYWLGMQWVHDGGHVIAGAGCWGGARMFKRWEIVTAAFLVVLLGVSGAAFSQNP